MSKRKPPDQQPSDREPPDPPDRPPTEGSPAAEPSEGLVSEGLALDDDVTFPDNALRAAFAPAGPRDTTSARPEPAREEGAGHASLLAAAEAYATEFREQPRYLQQWAESAPQSVQRLFLAIRANTLGDQVRDASAGPSRHDPTLPRLDDLSADLRELLAVSWPVWDRPRPGGSRPRD